MTARVRAVHLPRANRPAYYTDIYRRARELHYYYHRRVQHTWPPHRRRADISRAGNSREMRRFEIVNSLSLSLSPDVVETSLVKTPVNFLDDLQGSTCVYNDNKALLHDCRKHYALLHKSVLLRRLLLTSARRRHIQLNFSVNLKTLFSSLRNGLCRNEHVSI